MPQDLIAFSQELLISLFKDGQIERWPCDTCAHLGNVLRDLGRLFLELFPYCGQSVYVLEALQLERFHCQLLAKTLSVRLFQRHLIYP